MKSTTTPARRMPVGAEVQPGGGVHFRVWAPRSREVEVHWSAGSDGTDAAALRAEENGYFSGLIRDANVGALYKFRLSSGEFPDPASRFQPEGVHGRSQIVDPSRFAWSDASWPGVLREGQVIYEMHIGTFTREGTWRAAMNELPELARLGITLLEVMPVADFPGRFGWGYDGVDLFAPTRLYGSPDDFRAFVDRAHSLRLGVIIDVVYNHFGPDGNYLKEFSQHYLSSVHSSEWGEAPNFDGEASGPVRELVLANAAYWIAEFHLDGLRLDATQQIFDDSEDHLIAAVTRAARAAAKGRGIYVVAENEPQHTRLVRSPNARGYGLDALWNDDFHHAASVALTGHNEAYYTDYLGSPQELVSAAKWGYLYQGQRYKWQKKRRGTPALDLQPSAFVNFLENHDQVANSLRGLRVHQMTSPGRLRAMTAFVLLAPGTPMLFQGQEFAASSPFFYFADHSAELGPLVAEGRREFLRQFPSIGSVAAEQCLEDPAREETFLRCKLDFSERQKHAGIYRLHSDLLQRRREDAVFARPQKQRIDGAVLGAEAFVLRYFGDVGSDRLLVVNLGRDLHLDPAPEPLLAPPLDAKWKVLLSTEEPIYNGAGTSAIESEENWHLPGQAAVLLASAALEKDSHERTDQTH